MHTAALTCDINHKKKGEKMNSVSCTDRNRHDAGQTMTTMTVTREMEY